MMHDDGQHVEGLEDADVVLVGVSRTSKTPTSIYLANRGVRTANGPLVRGFRFRTNLETLKKPLVVNLHATTGAARADPAESSSRPGRPVEG